MVSEIDPEIYISQAGIIEDYYFLILKVFLLCLIEQKYHNIALYLSIHLLSSGNQNNISARKRFIYSYLKGMLVTGTRGQKIGPDTIIAVKVEEDVMLKLSFLFFILDSTMHSERSG